MTSAMVLPPLSELAPVLGSMLNTFMGLQEGAEHLQCVEAEDLAALYTVCGMHVAAAELIEYHAHGDDDEGDEHHARYRQIAGLPPLKREYDTREEAQA